MSVAQTIVDRLKEHLALPWPENVSPRERVVMVVYPPGDERKLRRLIESGEFAKEIRTTGHGWKEYDLATEFSRWFSANEYRDRYFYKLDGKASERFVAKMEELYREGGHEKGA